jgi:nucleotide-binding universal stress UspA family protein
MSPGNHGSQCGPIVVPTDGSELSRLAILEAGITGRQTGQSVVVVFLRHGLAATDMSVPVGTSVLVEDILLADQTVAEAQCITTLGPPGVDWSFASETCRSLDHLVRIADSLRAETIVIGRTRPGRIRRLLIPSPDDRLMRQWQRSLLIVYAVQSVDSQSTDCYEVLRRTFDQDLR